MLFFLIYYIFLDWLRLNCMEMFHYVAEKLRVYPLFEDKNKNIKINKERGAVYNDFDFDSTELLSECTSKITYSQTLVQDANDVFPLIWMNWYPKCPLIMPCWKQKKQRACFSQHIGF